MTYFSLGIGTGIESHLLEEKSVFKCKLSLHLEMSLSSSLSPGMVSSEVGKPNSHAYRETKKKALL